MIFTTPLLQENGFFYNSEWAGTIYSLKNYLISLIFLLTIVTSIKEDKFKSDKGMSLAGVNL